MGKYSDGRKDMCDMQKLDSSENGRSDARAEAGELPAAAAVDVHATSGDLPAAHAGVGQGRGGPRDMAGTIIKRIWLMLATEGGLWAAAETAKKLDIKPAAVCMAFNAMTARGYVRRYGTPQRYCYGVLPSSKLPQGVLLREVLAAVKGTT